MTKYSISLFLIDLIELHAHVQDCFVNHCIKIWETKLIKVRKVFKSYKFAILRYVELIYDISLYWSLLLCLKINKLDITHFETVKFIFGQEGPFQFTQCVSICVIPDLKSILLVVVLELKLGGNN